MIQSSAQGKGVALTLARGSVWNVTHCLSAFPLGPVSERRWGLAA